MENVFFKGICQIGIFMICAQTFVHFCPKGAYEKYLKMLVSIMVLIQMISPLGTILGHNGQDLEYFQTGDWLEEVLMKSMDEVLREKNLHLESIEKSLVGEGWEIDEEDAANEKEIETDIGNEYAEEVWKNEMQKCQENSENIEQQMRNIYIEPIAPIKIGQ